MEQPDLNSELSRDLSPFHLTMMGLGMMIGAGVFLGIGNAVYYSGPGGVLLTFALNTLLALFTAMSYAELSSAVPRAGGAYNFARIGFGRGVSFIAGWMEWFASSVAGSMYAVTFSIYFVRYIDHLGLLTWIGTPDILVKPVAVAVALFFIYINYRGASETGKIGAVMTLGQTLFLVCIGVVGIVVAVRDPSRLSNFNPVLPYGWSRLLITMGFTYVAFEGFEVIAQAGDEAIEPRKNLPKAMILSVFIAGVTYVAVAFAAIIAVKAGSEGVDIPPWQWIGSFRERGFGEAVGRLLPFGNLLLTIAVIFASTSALNATIYSATRASYALGRDGMLPGFFSRISKKRKTPWAALLMTGIIVLFVATVLPTMDVAASASMMFLFLFFLVNLCVIKIRLNMADELSYGYIMPLFPLFPVIALICQFLLAAELRETSLVAWIIAPSWVLLGFIIFRTYSRSHVLPSDDEIFTLEEHKAPEGDEYRIMVPLANPENAISLVRNTYRLSSSRPSRIELLHMVPVPEQVSLGDAEKYMTEGREAIVEAMLYLISSFPVTTALRYCRNIARGILSAVREKKIDLLIMGWHGNRRDERFRFGSTLDLVLTRAPCDMLVMKDCGNKVFQHILVPVSGGPNDAFAVETAVLLASGEKSSITLLPVSASSGTPERNLQRFQAYISESGIQAAIRYPFRGDTVNNILKEADFHDLVILGMTRTFLNKIGSASIPEQVAGTCKTPFILAKSPRGIESFTKKWI